MTIGSFAVRRVVMNLAPTCTSTIEDPKNNSLPLTWHLILHVFTCGCIWMQLYGWRVASNLTMGNLGFMVARGQGH